MRRTSELTNEESFPSLDWDVVLEFLDEAVDRIMPSVSPWHWSQWQAGDGAHFLRYDHYLDSGQLVISMCGKTLLTLDVAEWE
jgi:hypothetical protein